MRLIVDGMNVIGSRGDGWWLDREGAVRRLVSALARLAARRHEVITVVFDGELPPRPPEGWPGDVWVLEAGRTGPNAADDRIVGLVEADPRPWSLTVVTSDRRLGERVRRLGARVAGTRSLLVVLADG